LSKEGKSLLSTQANVVLFSGIVIDEEASIFDEAWNHKDVKARGMARCHKKGVL
jgi:hypothetical protein